MSERRTPLRVLILSGAPAISGGIVNFINLLKARLSDDIDADHFVMGRRANETSAFQTVARLLRDPIAFFVRVVRNRYDVVHINPSLLAKSTLREAVFCLLLKLIGYRGTFLLFHGWDKDFEKRIFTNPISRRMFCAAFGGASRYAVLSENFRESLIGIGFDPHRVVVLTTMFNGELLSQAGAPRTMPERRIVLFLARFDREKGLYELLEGFSLVADRFPDVDLVMAGDGDEAEGVRAWVAEHGAADRIKTPGYVTGPEKARLLLDASIFVLPSYFPEGLPVAMLEAMAAGTVLIVSNVGGIGEVARSPENGVVLDEISPRTVAAALERVLADPDYIAEVSERNRALAWQRYESRIVIDKVEDIYLEIAAEQGRPRVTP
jgi:glycosyltransferase involved in cell wall biosynthesis